MELSKLRKNANLTQEQLAKKMKVSTSTISSWENGKSEPTIKEEEKLMKILKLDEAPSTSRLRNEFHYAYVALILIVPAIYFILTGLIGINNITDAYNSNVDNFIIYLQKMETNLLISSIIFYLLYMSFILINYIYYKLNKRSTLMIAVAIEVAFLVINLGLLFIPELILFATPVLIGFIEIALINK